MESREIIKRGARERKKKEFKIPSPTCFYQFISRSSLFGFHTALINLPLSLRNNVHPLNPRDFSLQVFSGLTTKKEDQWCEILRCQWSVPTAVADRAWQIQSKISKRGRIYHVTNFKSWNKRITKAFAKKEVLYVWNKKQIFSMIIHRRQWAENWLKELYLSRAIEEEINFNSFQLRNEIIGDKKRINEIKKEWGYSNPIGNRHRQSRYRLRGTYQTLYRFLFVYTRRSICP